MINNLISKISNTKCELQMNQTYNIKKMTEIKKMFHRNGRWYTVFITEEQKSIDSKIFLK